MGGKDNSLFEKKNGPVYRTRWAFSEQLSGWTGKPMEYSPPLVAIDARQVDGYHGARVAPVAQLDRVLPSEGRGRGFESRLVHHRIQGFNLSDVIGANQPCRGSSGGAFLWARLWARSGATGAGRLHGSNSGAAC